MLTPDRNRDTEETLNPAVPIFERLGSLISTDFLVPFSYQRTPTIKDTKCVSSIETSEPAKYSICQFLTECCATGVLGDEQRQIGIIPC